MMKVKHRLNDTFVGIIRDIPNTDFNSDKYALMIKTKNSLMTYDQFYNIIYRCVLEYVPREGESTIFKAIKMLPKAIKNVQRIKQNNEIIRFQNIILDKYFYISGEDNIKEKLLELKNGINQIVEDNDLDILEPMLLRFDDRMRSGLLVDLENLSRLLEQRK